MENLIVRMSEPDQMSNAISREMDKCIGCTRCIRACSEMQGIGALESNPDGSPMVRPTGGVDLTETDCVGCGQCSGMCFHSPI
jgi:NADH-quinone oxidoreductase subunit G